MIGNEQKLFVSTDAIAVAKQCYYHQSIKLCNSTFLQLPTVNCEEGMRICLKAGCISGHMVWEMPGSNACCTVQFCAFMMHGTESTLTALPRSLVPNLGVNYPNWVWGPFELGNEPFFRWCFNHNIFYWA